MKLTPSIGWGAAIAAGAVADVICDRRGNDSTLSSVTRRAFRTDTTPGKVAFVAFYAGLSWWFVPHIVNDARKVVEEVLSS